MLDWGPKRKKERFAFINKGGKRGVGDMEDDIKVGVRQETICIDSDG